MSESAREIDSNGFLIVRGCPISTFGIFEYSAGQIGLEGDPNRIVKVYRPEYAVKDPDAIESFKDVPLVDDHEMLSGFSGDNESSDPDEKGVSGILTSNVYYQKPWMRGDVKIFSRGVKDKILNKIKDDLSLGFGCKYRLEPGVWNGQKYEVIQDHIRGNHLALVKEGRIPGARVLDGLCFDHMTFEIIENKGTKMIKNKFQKPNAKKTVKASDAKEDGEQGLDAGSPVDVLSALLPQLTAAFQAFLQQEKAEPAHEEGAPEAGGDPETVDPETDEMPEENGGEVGAEAVGEADPLATESNAVPEENAGEGTGEGVSEMLDQVKALVAQIEQQMAGGQDEDMPVPAGEDGEMPAALKQEEAKDVVEGIPGLQKNNLKGAQMETDKKAGDAALIKKFHVDASNKEKMYQRISRITGAFPHAAMDSKEVCEYGIKKLGIKCAKGTENIALDAYFNGVEAAAKTQAVVSSRKSGMDSVVKNGSSELNAYLDQGE